MKFDTRKYPPHNGICPMCKRSTRANVHQRCGIAREAELKAKRQPRLTRVALVEVGDE